MFFLDARAARITWTVLLIVAAIGLAYLLRHILLLFALAIFLTYLVFPLVTAVQRWLPLRGRRIAAIAVVYTVLLLGLSGIVAGVGPRLTRELQALADKLPAMSEQLKSGEIVGDVLERRGWEEEQIREAQRMVRMHAGEVIAYAQKAGAALLVWLTGAWVIVLIPVFAFFILKDAERITGGMISMLEKRRHRELWRGIVADLHVLFGEYVRALILLSIITCAAWSGVFLLAGVPYALVLAVIGGALEFIPVVGPLAAGIVVIGVSLFSGYGHPWLLGGFVLLWRGIQDYVSSPLIMGRGVEIHPALVIFGVIAGGEVAGVAGMFFAVPVLAAMHVLWRRVQALETRPTEAPPASVVRPPVTSPLSRIS
jgi:predicted PurR-regulated permease PerM